MFGEIKSNGRNKPEKQRIILFAWDSGATAQGSSQYLVP